MRCAQCRGVFSFTNYSLTERRNNWSFADWLPKVLSQSTGQYVPCSQTGMKFTQDKCVLNESRFLGQRKKQKGLQSR